MAPTITTYSGALEIIATGSLIVSEGDTASIYLDKRNAPFANEGFRVELIFSDEPEAKQRLSFKIASQTHVVVECVNFGNTLGTGSTKPIHVATSNGRKVMLSFIVYQIGANATLLRLAHYQVGLGEAE